MGDPAEIKTKRVKKRKTDRNDALLLLRLMREDNFPRIWVPSPENRDLRQLLWHRHRLVQMRTRIIKSLHGGASLAVSESAGSLSSAFLHQALLHDLFIQTNRDLASLACGRHWFNEQRLPSRGVHSYRTLHPRCGQTRPYCYSTISDRKSRLHSFL
jgi:hypothetical protein